MSVVIHKVNSKDELMKFIQFGIDLYEGNEFFVPPLVYDERTTLRIDKNPAFEHCDATYFLAYRDGEIVGRIGAIINYKANEIWNEKNARFGFVDFVDDNEVVDALFGAAESWARSRGMEKMHGPLGFTDLDHEGMLVEGFDQMGTLSTIYNYPYYVDHMERLGYMKDQDWVEFLITIPKEMPERFLRASEIVKKRSGLEVKHLQSKKDVYPYAREIFKLINRAYKDLYGYVELTEKQIDYYVDMYIPMLRLEFLTLVIRQEDNKLVGVGIGLPSIAKALQKAKGRFLPGGWYHLYRALKGKGNNVLDLLLVAVDPEYQGKGINALLFNEFIPAASRLGFEYAESNPELDLNHKVKSMWNDLDAKHTKRRRAFIKQL
ncbi:MAG: GNAT family N-acetyltransferase [Proteiniphilum sp.]|jgi:GNAT superfamily N-acetyltransferase|nr:GNAT family N-acetyltransferase [Proteiniphilum sp.]NCB24775.1 GNAT family N-acetyltransferase [Bacteroidia bacterium]MDD2937660.1 GNAT family N-acetyltransferase [Proteiniphilum sp.]MDD3076135.1 GNAT family N-acetyltransferase [Proteiniphilum sp.]MDD3779060.1 GNAT family N-acetyltransferase [Proteiniphilum sp.]